MKRNVKRLSPSGKVLQQILTKSMTNEIEEIPDKYGLLEEELRNYKITLHVEELDKVPHKGGRTRFMKVFLTEARLLYANKVVDYKEFGFLSFLGIMFTSYEDNVLRNEDGTPCTQKDIIELSGLARSTVNAFLKELIEKSLLFEEDNPDVHKGKMYYLNHNLFYQGNSLSSNKKSYYNKIEKQVLQKWASNNKDKKLTDKQQKKLKEAIDAIIDFDLSLEDED